MNKQQELKHGLALAAAKIMLNLVAYASGELEALMNADEDAEELAQALLKDGNLPDPEQLHFLAFSASCYDDLSPGIVVHFYYTTQWIKNYYGG